MRRRDSIDAAHQLHAFLQRHHRDDEGVDVAGVAAADREEIALGASESLGLCTSEVPRAGNLLNLTHTTVGNRRARRLFPNREFERC
jgi:hypothetical protein